MDDRWFMEEKMVNQTVKIKVDASKWTGKLEHNWNYVGYDECNYTHSPGGIELIKKLGNLEKPYYLRAHHMLCTGIGHGQYKWGSTNAYIEDEKGNPIYDFTMIDEMCDIWLNNNCKPFFEIGFMPMDLVDLSYVENRGNLRYEEYKRNGWAKPPKDYDKWYGLIKALIEHLLARYGQKELETWYFEMWNEPDISYWRGTHEEFCKLYDYTEAAVHDACSSLRFGGPASRGALTPDSNEANYLRKFLQHTRNEKNYRSGKTGTRLDFTSFHTKGGNFYFTTKKEPENTPSVKILLVKARHCAEIINEFGYGDLECVMSEVDPDGYAAGGRFDNPTFNFRNTEYYPSYVASTYKNLDDLSRELKIDLRPLAWAFMFEGERCFEGTRTFTTQGIDKAVMNLFKLYAKLGTQMVELSSSGAKDPELYKDNWGTGEGAEINGWATVSGDRSLETLIYCHEDTWAEDGVYPVEFAAENLPFTGPCKITHYRIDKEHSNAYAEWARQGRPNWPAGGQYEAIKARSGLELLEPVKTVVPLDGKVKLTFELPVKSVSLVIIEKV
jgi:xylan 1,4-beta-xylosidase